jgi:hypothetical protein
MWLLEEGFEGLNDWLLNFYITRRLCCEKCSGVVDSFEVSLRSNKSRLLIRAKAAGGGNELGFSCGC